MDMMKARIFLYAMDSGSLSKAALAFEYTPSGISRMMTSFEDEVGFPLFIRTKTGVLPTSNAERLIPIIRQQLSLDDQFSAVLNDISGLNKGTLNIATYSSVSSMWLPKVIAEFSKDFPGIKINLLEGVWKEVSDYLIEKRADIGIYSYQPSINYKWIFLRKDPMVVSVHKNHHLVEKGYVEYEDLEKENIILPAQGVDIDVLNLIKNKNIKLNIVYTTIENYSAMSLAEENLGVVISNELITKVRDIDIVTLPIRPESHIDLGIALSYENEKTPAVVKFVSYAKRILGENNE